MASKGTETNAEGGLVEYTYHYLGGVATLKADDGGGKRILAEYDYAPGTARGEAGENLQSDFAAIEIQKVRYRASHLGSSLFAVDADGAVISHTVYDPWGNPLTATYPDANFAGMDNRSNYTGYTWDEVLELYFAQNRFYDAETHRFTQEDTVKDGSNWYVYCANSPMRYVDFWGLDATYISGEHTIYTETMNNAEFASVRALIDAVGASKFSEVNSASGLAYWANVSFTTATGQTQNINFSLNSAKGQLTITNTTTGKYKTVYRTDLDSQSSDMVLKGWTHYMSIEYFEKLLCELGYDVSMDNIDTLLNNYLNGGALTVDQMASISYYLSHNDNGSNWWGPKDTARQKKFIYAYMVNEFGWAPEISLGFLANIAHEGAFSPTNLEEGGGTGTDNRWYITQYNPNDKLGWGIVQWTASSRKQNLLNFANQRGTDVGDLATQLEFLRHEIETVGEYGRVYDYIQNTQKPDLHTFTELVLRVYESPANAGSKVNERNATADVLKKELLP